MSIWNYNHFFTPRIGNQYKLENNCGNTPLTVYEPQFQSIGIENIKFKREDLNPTGSHKDRSLLYQISSHFQNGSRSFVIASSGNSLISAAYILKDSPELTMKVFLSKKISTRKLQRLSKILGQRVLEPNDSTSQQSFNRISITFTSKPLSEAIQFANKTESVLLRGSTDPYALQGFKTIAYELAEQAAQAKEIFIPTSSATTAYGIHLGYKDLLAQGTITKIPALHIVQSEAVNPIARDFDKVFNREKTSLIDSIVDRVAHRKAEILDAIKATEGSGWVVNDQECLKIQDMLNRNGINTSIEGAMTVAAVKKAIENKHPINDPICIITGTR